jgi:uncharacterized membrane protein YfcA
MRRKTPMTSLQFTGGLIGFLAHLMLVYLIVKKQHIKAEQNFTTWLLAGLIDVFISIITYRNDGNYYFPIFYSLGAFSIALVLLWKKRVCLESWDRIIVVLVVICLTIWMRAKDNISLIAFIMASVASFIPQIRDTARKPRSTPILAYYVFFIGDFVSFTSGKDFSAKEVLYSFTEMILSTIIIMLIWNQRKIRGKI